MSGDNLKFILVFSGKRKSGKDYIVNILQNKIGEDCSILRLSGPLKEQYAKEHNLDFDRLLDATEYKEYYRVDMIKWGEDVRRKDPAYFCRHAIIQSGAEEKKIWIISDARRKTDLEFFTINYPNITYLVRVIASNDIRKCRGWEHTPGVDDAESECDLDSFGKWDFTIVNDGNEKELEKCLSPILKLISR